MLKLDADILTPTTLHWPWCTEHSTQASLICLRHDQKFYLFSYFTTILSEILLIFRKIANIGKILAESYSGCYSLHLRYYKPMFGYNYYPKFAKS